MVSRADVERWRAEEIDKDERLHRASSFAIQYEWMCPGDPRVVAMADMLAEAMDKLGGVVAQMDVGFRCPWCSEWPNGPHAEDCALGVLFREWHGEEATGGDDAVDGARDGA